MYWRRIAYWIIIVALVTVNIRLLFRNRDTKSLYVNLAENYTTYKQSATERENVLINISQHLHLPDSLANQKGVFFLFSDNMCYSCIETELVRLTDKIGTVQFVFFSERRENLRNYPLLARHENVIVVEKSAEWGLEISSISVPIIFYTDGQCIRNIFIPNKLDTSFSSQYYQTIFSSL